MVNLLIVLALISGGAGLLFLSQATTGVGFLAGGCLLGILARLAQAAEYHRQYLTASESRSQPAKTA